MVTGSPWASSSRARSSRWRCRHAPIVQAGLGHERTLEGAPAGAHGSGQVVDGGATRRRTSDGSRERLRPLVHRVGQHQRLLGHLRQLVEQDADQPLVLGAGQVEQRRQADGVDDQLPQQARAR